MPRARGARSALLVLAVLCGGLAHADAGWFESGDPLLRADLTLLNDAGIIVLPTTQWPIPRASVEYALRSAKDFFATNAAVQLALARVRARVEQRAARLDARVTAGEAGLLRGFNEVGRESGELRAGAHWSNDRFSVTARVSGAADPADDQSVRADGSEATLRLGNWLLSAHTLDRFWGPAHDSGLILTNNARPMPTFMIERAEAREFESPWLSWLGPWRFSLGVSRMESERADIDAPLFMAWRVTIMPFREFELGFSRTAQFCGKTLPCNFDSIKDMLLGNDNIGFDATPESEPGNQMAGFDIRWNSPLGNLPYAVYSQMIGEDESGYLPVKYLAQFGIEAWKPTVDGGIFQGYAEYIDTTCQANTRDDGFNCVYNQGLFNVEGYRYRGRVLGHTADRDAEGMTYGISYTRPRGDFLALTVRSMRLNRDDDFDPRNTVAQVKTFYHSVDLGWRRRLLGGEVAAEIGAQSLETAADGRDIEPYGYLSFTYDLAR